MKKTPHYNYDPETKEYKGIGESFENPVRAGTFIHPANSTVIAPPPPKKGYTCVFDKKNESWEQKADFRRKIYWDTETLEKHEITQLGDTPAKNWTDKEPPDNGHAWNGEKWILPIETAKERLLFASGAAAHKKKLILDKSRFSVEIESFEIQKKGAFDILNNAEANTTEAQFVKSLAKYRGKDPESLAQSIMKHAGEYEASLAEIVSEHQEINNQIKSAETEDELKIIEQKLTLLN